jgi:hypothetical protein
MEFHTRTERNRTMFITNNELVGRRVEIQTAQDEWETALVIAVSDRTANIKVRAEDGDILIGGQWEEI